MTDAQYRQGESFEPRYYLVSKRDTIRIDLTTQMGVQDALTILTKTGKPKEERRADER